jgi:cytochrome c
LRGQRTFRRDDSAARYDHGAALRAALCVSCHGEKRDGQEKEYRFFHMVGRKNI